jgi:hypothetical protein
MNERTIRLTEKEFELVVDALSTAARASMLVATEAHLHLTSRGRNALNVQRVDCIELRSSMFKRWQAAETP